MVKSFRRYKRLKGFKKSRSVVPEDVLWFLYEVFTQPSRYWNKGNFIWIVTNLFNEEGYFIDNLIEPILGSINLVHFVDTNDELLDPKSECEKNVVPGLSLFRNTCFELSFRGCDNEDGTIGLDSTIDHVLNESSVPWDVDGSVWVFAGFEWFLGHLYSDASLSFDL